MIARPLAGALLAFAVIAAPAVALAQTDSANAEALFNEAKTLVEQGNWPDACAKLEQSQKLDPRPTTQYRLADCQEHIGRLASARGNFLAAAAAVEGKRREAALDRAHALEPRVPQLEVRVTNPPPDLIVTWDGRQVPPSKYGSPLPVDLGGHAILATAFGRRPFSAQVQVTREGGVTEVLIPPLVEDTGGPPITAPGETSAQVFSSSDVYRGSAYGGDADTRARGGDSAALRISGILVGLVGIGAIAGGAIAYATAPTDCGAQCIAAASLLVNGAIATSIGIALLTVSFDHGVGPASTASPGPFEPVRPRVWGLALRRSF